MTLQKSLYYQWILLPLFLISTSVCFGENRDILQYGAVADGKTVCTKAIQQAIDECSGSGGGEVRIPAGTFLSGTLHLKDNVFLNLDPGAILLGSTDMKDYAPKGMIRAVRQKNIGIIGHGVIDGQGWAFWEKKKEPRKSMFGMNPAWNFEHKAQRPDILVQFEDCRSVRLRNVTLKNSEAWTLHLLACEDVVVDGVTIRNPQHGPNTDGIDINGSRRVRILNCDIYTNDDAICLKNKDPKYWDRPCEDILVTNCILTTSCNAFKIGTETIGDFRNIVFSNSVIKAGDPENELSVLASQQALPGHYGNILSPRSGISLETVDGSHVSDIVISNIVMEARVPLFIRLGNRGRKANTMDPASVPGTLKNVIISNIVAYNASTTSSVTGLAGYHVENIKISNMIIHTEGGGDAALARKIPDEMEKSYPNATMWGHLPASGLFVRHVKDIEIKDISILISKADERPLLIFDDVAGLRVDNLRTNDLHRGESLLDFTNVRGARLLNSDFSGSHISRWMSFSGSETKDIRLFFPDVPEIKSRVKTDAAIPSGVITVH